MSQKPIDKVIAEQTDSLLAIPGVVGVGIGQLEGKPCVKVFVMKKRNEVEERIPKNLEGYPVAIEVSGEIRAY